MMLITMLPAPLPSLLRKPTGVEVAHHWRLILTNTEKWKYNRLCSKILVLHCCIELIIFPWPSFLWKAKWSMGWTQIFGNAADMLYYQIKILDNLFFIKPQSTVNIWFLVYQQWIWVVSYFPSPNLWKQASQTRWGFLKLGTSAWNEKRMRL